MSLSLAKKSWLFDLVLLAFFIGCAYFITLGLPPLYLPDEGRYAEIGREMLLSHHFITPHLDGLPYFEKPPLTYWGIALFEWLFGMSEWAVRALNASLALLICLLVYGAGRCCFNRLTGLFAALMLASSLLFFSVTHLVNTDVCLTFCLCLSLFAFLSWVRLDQKGQSHPALLYCAYGGAALAVLSKGLIGIVFPGMILFLWLLLGSRFRLLRKMHLARGFLLFLLIALPWHILAQKQNPTFLHEYFYVNHYLRFTTPIMHREMDKILYIGLFFASFLPWILLLLRHSRSLIHSLLHPRIYPFENFLLCWIVSIFLFFGFSNSVLATYLLPILPPFALLTAPFLTRLWQENRQHARVKVSLSLSLAFLILNLAWMMAPHYVHKSTKPLALTVHSFLAIHPDANVLNYNYYYQDFPYYSQHFVEIAGWEDELKYGQSVNPEHSVLIDRSLFWQKVASPIPAYVVTNEESWAEIRLQHPNQLFLIESTGPYVLLGNAPATAPHPFLGKSAS